MYEIHVFNKILRGRHFSEEKRKEEAIKDNFDFILRLIHSMSDITNISLVVSKIRMPEFFVC